MSDESSVTAESRPAGRLSRLVPSWARRRPLLTGFGAGIVAAALIAGGVYEAQLPSGPPRGAYTSAPRQPCAMISAAELAKVLPGAAAGTPESVTVTSPVSEGQCKWSSTTGSETRTLIGQVVVFGSSSSVRLAQQLYRGTVVNFGCHCPGVTASTRPVTGVGDQATRAFVAAGPEADFASSPSADLPGTSLLVRSSNAVVVLDLDATATATGASLATPPSGAQVAAMVSMARGVLDALARPDSAPAAASAPLSPEPHYAGRRDPCRLITAATLARYASGATLGLGPTPSSAQNQARSDGCTWSSDDTFVFLTLNTFPSAARAGQAYQEDAASLGRSGNGVTGTESLPGIGELGAAIFRTQSGQAGVEMLVWSGNAELQYWYASTSGPPRPRAELLAGAIAMSRDSLAALSSPAASSYLPEPRYASPHDDCALAKPATLARYVPGATVDRLPTTGGGSAVPETSGCDWTSDSTGMLLSLTIAADPDSATGSYQLDLRDARKGQDGTKFLGAQPVHGVGEQATAVYQTLSASNAPTVALYVLSGNASVEVSASDVGIGAPLSRAGKLAADIAMARDVLASLHRA
jgi:hypothetical protein